MVQHKRIRYKRASIINFIFVRSFFFPCFRSLILAGREPCMLNYGINYAMWVQRCGYSDNEKWTLQKIEQFCRL